MRNTKVLIALAVLLSMSSAMRANAQEVFIERYAHFVSWFCQQEPGVRECQWDEASVFPRRRGPGVGEGYSSRDPDIIREQNAEFIEYGITPLASWAGIGYFAGDDFYDAYLAVPSPVKIGTLYEVTVLLKDTNPDNDTVERFDMDDPENRQKFVADIMHLKTRYFDRYPERFATIDGRIVLFIWLTGLMDGDLQEAFAPVRDIVYIIGSEVSPYAPGRFTEGRLSVIRGLDAVSSYGQSFSDFHNGRLDAEYVGQMISSYRLWSRFLQVHAPDVELIVPMQFSANDTGIPGREPYAPPLSSSYDEAYYAAEQMREFLTEAYLGCAMTNVRPAVNITSYNEHPEGTSMEAWKANPDIPQPYDYDADHDYLNVVRAVFGPPIASSPVNCPQ